MGRHYTVLVVVLTVLACACTASSPAAHCVAGQVSACPCVGGGQGAQTCNPANGVFGACVCPGVDAGTDVPATSTDVQPAVDVVQASDVVTSMDVATPPVDVTVPTDAGTDVPTGGDGGCSSVEGAMTPITYPAGPYGSSVGSTFQPLSLMPCNGTAAWNFDQPDFYTSTMTVISIAAGWCVPCQMESAEIQEMIETVFAGRCVRVVQIIVQNPDHSAITSEFCNEWVARYGIGFPELMDPLMLSSVYTPAQAFPGNVIVDRHGVIRWREYGETTGLTDLVAAIEDVLADPTGPGE